jgi:hypothetical protein
MNAVAYVEKCAGGYTGEGFKQGSATGLIKAPEWTRPKK